MNKFLAVIVLDILLLLLGGSGHAQDQREFGRLQTPCEVGADINAQLKRFIDVDKAEIRNPRDAREVLKLFFATMKAAPSQCLNLIDVAGDGLTSAERKCKSADAVDVDASDFYAIIHVLKWNNPPPATNGGDGSRASQAPASPNLPAHPQAPQSPRGQNTGSGGTTANEGGSPFPADATTPPQGVPGGDSEGSVLGASPGGVQTVEKQNWYVYHSGNWSQEDFATRKHIPGNQYAWLIYIHVNRQEFYKVSYDVAITKVIPAPWRNARDLAQLAVQARAQEVNQPATEVWGGACIPINARPSQLAVTPQFLPAVPIGGTQLRSLGDVTNFDNEGPYRFDFGVGVPIRKIGQLDFSSEDGTVAAKEVDKTQLFGLVDIFWKPVDFKRQTFSRYPFLVVGVALTGKPLDHGIIGFGWGTKLASIYLGAAIVKQEELQTLSAGDAATQDQVDADVRSSRKAEFAFGLHLSARAVRDLLQANP